MGGLSRQPLGAPNQFQQGVRTMQDWLMLAQRQQALQELTRERRERLGIAEQELKERQQKSAREQAKALFTEKAEEATGAAPTPETMQWLGPLQRAIQGQAFPGTQTMREELPSGGMLARPWSTPGDIAAAARQATSMARSATEEAAKALPEGPEKERMLGMVKRGELRVPSAVPGAFEKAIETGQKAQTLTEARRTEEQRVAKGEAESRKAQIDARVAAINETYAVPMKEAEIAEKTAQTARAAALTRKEAREMGEAPLIPGSPQALDAAAKQEDLNTKRFNAEKARIEADQHRRYLTAMDDFRRTGDIGHLNRAITFATNGAIETDKIIRSGERLEMERYQQAIAATDRTMALRTQLQESLNAKDLPGAQGRASELNNHNVMLSSILKSPTVDWTSVRREEGMFGRPVSAHVTVTREEALALMNDAVRPDSAQGLALLLKANYGDLVNRAEGGDPTAYQRLVQVAGTYPGVSQEASDQVIGFLQKRMASKVKTLAPVAEPVVPPAQIGPKLRGPRVGAPGELGRSFGRPAEIAEEP